MFIEEYSDLVSVELCEQIIAHFESDSRRGPSTVGNYGHVSELRTGTLLRPGPDKSEAWRTLINAVAPALNVALARYAEKYPGIKAVIEREGLLCKNPLVERVDPGQGFDWHYDQSFASPHRVIACLLYLRTIKDGGYTEFKDQNRRIRPTAGKLAFFPPYWTHFHRGVSPTKDPKYVMSFFWVYAASEAVPERRPGILGNVLGLLKAK